MYLFIFKLLLFEFTFFTVITLQYSFLVIFSIKIKLYFAFLLASFFNYISIYIYILIFLFFKLYNFFIILHLMFFVFIGLSFYLMYITDILIFSTITDNISWHFQLKINSFFIFFYDYNFTHLFIIKSKLLFNNPNYFLINFFENFSSLTTTLISFDSYWYINSIFLTSINRVILLTYYYYYLTSLYLIFWCFIFWCSFSLIFYFHKK